MAKKKKSDLLNKITGDAPKKDVLKEDNHGRVSVQREVDGKKHVRLIFKHRLDTHLKAGWKTV